MSTEPTTKARMTVAGAAFLGVGSMVGAGIFALLGEAGAVAGSAVWISFLAGGVLAGLLGYVVVKLGARYPSSGGIVTFLTEGFGPGHIAGAFSWMLYFAAIIVTAMVSVSFGSYATALFVGDNASDVWPTLFTTVGIIAVAVVNVLGSGFISKFGTLIAIVLLVVFGVFIVVLIPEVDTHLLAPSSYPGTSDIISSVALTFFAYLGFAVISYTSGDLANPKRDLPRAMFLALFVTTLLYVVVSLCVFGTLTVAEVIQHGDTALAEAARPQLGDAGFAMMAIAALVATVGSINANIYGAVGSTSALAETGQFPRVFVKRGLLGNKRGLTITVIITLLLANLVDLTAIASLGSMVALTIFIMVGVAGFKLRSEINASAIIIVTAIVASLFVIVMFLIDTLENEPATFVAMIGVLVLAVVLEYLWSAIRRRRRVQTPSPA